MKICTHCKEESQEDMFSKDKSRKDGLQPWCKYCAKQYRQENKEKAKQYRYANKEVAAAHHKQYIQNNKEAISTYNKQWEKENRERRAEQKKQWNQANETYMKQWYQSNKTTIKTQQKQYYQDNKIAIAARHKQYDKEHRAENRIKRQRRKTKERLLPYTLTIKQWDYIKQYFENKCAYCNRELPLTQEHFIALSKGGEYTHNNIIPSCISCNSSKRDNDFFAWYPKYKHYSKNREKQILKFLNYSNGLQQLSLI